MRFQFKQLIVAGLALALIATLATLAQSKVGERALRTIGVAAPSPPYTELAFVAPQRLPTALQSTGTVVRLPFTITNREHVTKRYTWRITAAGSSPSGLVRTGSVRLDAGAQAYLDPAVTLRCARRTRLTVRLDTGQYIDLWAACTLVRPPGSPHPTGGVGTAAVQSIGGQAT